MSQGETAFQPSRKETRWENLTRVRRALRRAASLASVETPGSRAGGGSPQHRKVTRWTPQVESSWEERRWRPSGQHHRADARGRTLERPETQESIGRAGSLTAEGSATDSTRGARP
jgi:hypothetical protein